MPLFTTGGVSNKHWLFSVRPALLWLTIQLENGEGKYIQGYSLWQSCEQSHLFSLVPLFSFLCCLIFKHMPIHPHLQLTKSAWLYCLHIHFCMLRHWPDLYTVIPSHSLSFCTWILCPDINPQLLFAGSQRNTDHGIRLSYQFYRRLLFNYSSDQGGNSVKKYPDSWGHGLPGRVSGLVWGGEMWREEGNRRAWWTQPCGGVELLSLHKKSSARCCITTQNWVSVPSIHIHRVNYSFPCQPCYKCGSVQYKKTTL